MAEPGEVKIPVQVIAEAVVAELSVLEVKYGEVLVVRLPEAEPEIHRAVFDAIRGTLRYQGVEPPPLLVMSKEVEVSTMELKQGPLDFVIEQITDRLIERLEQRAASERDLARALLEPNQQVKTGGLVDELRALRQPPVTIETPPGHPLHGAFPSDADISRAQEGFLGREVDWP